MPAAELLVLLEPDPPPGLRDRLRSQFRVTQEGSPRLLVVERPSDPAVLRDLPGVRAVVDDAVAADALTGLDDGESLFVQAWLRRDSMRTKRRPGEGLDWDAPGRLPPDPPRDRSGSSSNQGG